ncbi:MAG: fatty acid desaturase [Bradymonadales bacterium]|nr:MAG: fatty acid desaturase [Bradymonadales bacterium]
MGFKRLAFLFTQLNSLLYLVSELVQHACDMLRYRADIRSLVYGAACLVLFILNFRHGGIHPILYPLLLFFSFSTAIMAHNHNHLPMFKSNVLNVLWSHFLSFFYGHPVSVWVPVHNRNHHTHTNAPGDWSATYQHSKKNNLLSLVSYNWVAGAVEFKGALRYFAGLRLKNPKAFALVCLEYIVWAGLILGFLLYDWRKALLYLIIPGQLTVFSIHVFNYLQHVDTDYKSEWDHSRNFLGKWANRILFNNGYHTQHHTTPMMHWSRLPEAHQKIHYQIDPRLNERDPISFCFRTYILGKKRKPLKPIEITA